MGFLDITSLNREEWLVYIRSQSIYRILKDRA